MKKIRILTTSETQLILRKNITIDIADKKFISNMILSEQKKIFQKKRIGLTFPGKRMIDIK